VPLSIFPDRTRTRRRRPDESRGVLRLLAALMFAASACISVALLADHPSAMAGALLVHLVLVVAAGRSGIEHLTAATDDELLAVAVTSGAEGRHTTRVGVHSVQSLAQSDAPTSVIPQVTT
jgi:hypothetical protein